MQVLNEIEAAAEPELWAPIPEFERRYDVSSQGRIRSWGTCKFRLRPPKIRRISRDKDGYLFITLHDASRNKMKGFRVSRLVLLAFRGCPPSPQHEASHLDGDKTNNSLGNLAWETHQENDGRKEIHGTRLHGETSSSAKLNEARVREIRARRANGETVKLLADEFNVSPGTISSAVSGRTWASVE